MGAPTLNAGLINARAKSEVPKSKAAAASNKPRSAKKNRTVAKSPSKRCADLGEQGAEDRNQRAGRELNAKRPTPKSTRTVSDSRGAVRVLAIPSLHQYHNRWSNIWCDGRANTE